LVAERPAANISSIFRTRGSLIIIK